VSNTVVLINTVLTRLNAAQTDTQMRADVLTWLQQAEDEEWALVDYWFKVEERAFTFVLGTDSYVLDPDVATVEKLSDVNGLPLIFVPHYDFDLNLSVIVLGTPEAWTLVDRDPSSRLLKIQLFPRPDANNTGLARYRLRAATLADDSANFSRFPEEFHPLLIQRALEFATLKTGKPLEAQVYAARAESMRANIIAQNNEMRAAR